MSKSSSKTYSKFSFDELKDLGIKVIERSLGLQKKAKPILPSDFLLKILERNQKLKMKTEKAKSEFIIAPILAEFVEKNIDKIACYSGYLFNVDTKLGLNGYCDFLLTLQPEAVQIEAPVFFVVEAKNDNLDNGMPQCIAELYAASIFNQKKGNIRTKIYGAVTFGFEWKFVEYSDNQAIIDTDIYYFNELEKILGILEYITNE